VDILRFDLQTFAPGTLDESATKPCGTISSSTYTPLQTRVKAHFSALHDTMCPRARNKNLETRNLQTGVAQSAQQVT
jgi:hypothetical protein